MNRIFFRAGILASFVALIFGVSQRVCGQATAVGDYTTLQTALNSGVTTITNFNPTNSSTSPIIIHFTTTSEPTFQITNNVVIDAGSNFVVFESSSNSSGTRFFFVHSNASLTLNNIALVDGGSTNGGAVYNQGTLVISNCVLQGNMATNASGASGGNGPVGGQGNGTNGAPGGSTAGGAIYSTGPLYIYFSIFTNNIAQAGNGGNGGNASGAIGNGGSAGYGGNSFGGAIYSTGSTNVIFMTEFAGNNCIAGNGGTGGVFATNQLPFQGSGGVAGVGGSCAGGAAYIAGRLYMTNCLFFTNFAVGGGSGAAEVDSNGGGAEGSPGGSAQGGSLYLTNASAAASIENSIFFFNACYGGYGGSTALNAAVGGQGGLARGGGIWSSMGLAEMRFCTLATNLVTGGVGGANTSTNVGGGFSGSAGSVAGWNIFRPSGNFALGSSIASSGNLPNLNGVTDEGYNVISDASLAKSSIIPTTKLNTNPQLDSGLSSTVTRVGGGLGTTMFTLAILTNSPAAAFVPGVPGATFSATDERLFPRATPTSAGAFDVNYIKSFPTNVVLPTIVSTLPPTNLTGAGATVSFTNTVDIKNYTGLPFGYQWQFNGSNIFDNGVYAGTTTNILTVRNLNITDQGQYALVISPSLLIGAETSAVVSLILTNPPSIIRQPVSQINRPSGSIVVFTLGVASPLNFDYQWRLNGTNLAGGSEYSGTNSNQLMIDPATEQDAGLYSVIVSNDFGARTSVVVRLSIVPDHAKPTVLVQSPKANNLRTNSITLSGTATDNAQVFSVNYWITNINAGLPPGQQTNVMMGSADLTTNGSTNFDAPNTMLWSITNTLLPGTNILAVRAMDFSSNLSAVITRKFFYQVTSPMTLSISNNGGRGKVVGHSSISGDPAPSYASNISLNIGEGYSLVATPSNTASLLGDWTNTYSGSNGIVTTVTNGNTLKFIMESNTVVTASFVSNIFPALHGTYNGLFYVAPEFVSNDISTNTVGTNQVVTTNAIYTNEVAFQTAGMLQNLSLSKTGNFTARVLLAGGNYGLSGLFNSLGQATNTVTRPASHGGPLTVTLSLDTNGSGVITGAVTNASWDTNAALWAHLSFTAPGTSNYTMVLAPPTNGPTNFPIGYGYGLIADHGGTVSLTGGLADGTTFSQTAHNSVSNIIPVYVSLYQKTGFLFGWLNLTNLNNTNADYELMWIKGTMPHPTPLFPAGFTNMVLAVGSPWTNQTPIVLPTNSVLTVSNSFLNFDFPVSIKNNSVLFNTAAAPTNSLTGTINPRTGQLLVTFGNGNGRQTTRGFGAMLQDLGEAAGYFAVTTNSGLILLESTNQPVNIPLIGSQGTGSSSSSTDTYLEGESATMIINSSLVGPPKPPPLLLPTLPYH